MFLVCTRPPISSLIVLRGVCEITYLTSSMPVVVAKIHNRQPRLACSDRCWVKAGEGFKYRAVSLGAARLSQCRRWLGACNSER